MQKDKSAILLSGGLDSIAVAYWKKPEIAITIDYGQLPAKSEIHAATQVANRLGIDHYIISANCSKLGSGDLSNNNSLHIAPVSEWWPYRNQLLITLACMKGVSLGVKRLLVGSVKSDKSHIDGTVKFYKMISELVELQEGNVIVDAPAISFTTNDLIKESKVPLSILRWAHSCHTSNIPCMRCNGCKKYLYTIQQLGIDNEKPIS